MIVFESLSKCLKPLTVLFQVAERGRYARGARPTAAAGGTLPYWCQINSSNNLLIHLDRRFEYFTQSDRVVSFTRALCVVKWKWVTECVQCDIVRYRWWRHGLHDEEEAVQVWGAVLPGGADWGALRVGGALRQDTLARRRELPGTF